MTVCIAAICGSPDVPQIILCTDLRGSSYVGTSEFKIKNRSLLPHRWRCLTAGDDGEVLALVRVLQKYFIDAAVAKKDIDETNVVQLTEKSLAERKRHKADRFAQSQFGLSYEELFKTGKEKLPPEIFYSAMDSIKKITVEADLVIAGFYNGFPLILETTASGNVKIREAFGIVGEGDLLAQASLLQREYNETTELEQAIFCVYEAKKHSERVPSVGKYTSMYVLSPNGTIENLHSDGRRFLDQKCMDFGPQSISDKVVFDRKFLKKFSAPEDT